MIPSTSHKQLVNDALQQWRQGDVALGVELPFVHLADLSRPLTTTSEEMAEQGASGIGVVYENKIDGYVVISQTCDIVRECEKREYITIAPLIEVSLQTAKEIKSARQPRYAHIPSIYEKNLVADLDRAVTVEKSIISDWNRIPGWTTDREGRQFSLALMRHKGRFAFPDDFVEASSMMQNKLVNAHGKQTSEGAHLSALREIRVRAAPSWNADAVNLTYWFIKDREPEGCEPNWATHIQEWTSLFSKDSRFQIEAAIPCELKDITAADYTDSDQLDLDRLSI